MHPDIICVLAGIQRIEGYDRVLFKWWWLTLPVAALMIALAIWKAVVLLIAWLRMPSDCPNKLFHQLARLHHLSREELRWITQLSEKLPPEIPRPGLFVEPRCWIWSQPPVANQAEVGEKLFEKIFGFPPDRPSSK